MAYILEKIGNTYNLPKKYFTCDAKSDLDGISLVDVPIGSEAYCILEEESYILDSNKQWHKKKIGEDLTGQVQADLSQTDSTQADYVKGVIRQESLPEGYPYKSEEAILDGTFEFIDQNGIYVCTISDENFSYADGKSYTVIWDGTTYQCVATTFQGMPVLGNLAIAGAGADTGEPFLFDDQGNGQKLIGTNSTSATHTITVRREIIYPMDNEYLHLQNSNIINDLADGSLKTYGAKEATGSYSFAEGKDTVASGYAAHAEGNDTIASGEYSHAEGSGTIASGEYSHAEGSGTIASGNYSHAEGRGNLQYIRISGEAGATVYTVTSSISLPIIDGSLIKYNNQIVREILSYNSSEKKLTLDATLNNNEALNSIQVIIVENGIAGGSYSHSEGQGSVAFGNSQHVQGKYNIVDSSNKYSHIVGNGSLHSARSNAHTLDWNGNAWFAGDVYVKGTGQDDTAAVKLATLNDIPDLTIENGMILKNLQAAMPSSASWHSVTYGNGKFVAVDNSNNSTKAAYSEDGVTWTATTMPNNASWQSVTYGNGKFVAVADHSYTAAYSEDGIAWTKTTLPLSKPWQSVAYGNGKFVALAGLSGTAVYSEDGITWTATDTIPTASWQSVTYGNGKFVAVANVSTTAVYSEDGITWTETTMPSTSQWISVTYGNGKFVAVAYNNSTIAAYSEDGITWSSSTMPSTASWWPITYGNGKFVAVADNSDTAAYSEDGINWTVSTLPISRYWRSVTYGNGKFVAVASSSADTAFSYDGINWQTELKIISQNESDITESVRSVIGIPSYSTANNGQFLRVIDGIPTWTEFLPTLTSPNGTKYQLTVSDDGTLSAVAVS